MPYHFVEANFITQPPPRNTPARNAAILAALKQAGYTVKTTTLAPLTIVPDAPTTRRTGKGK